MIAYRTKTLRKLILFQMVIALLGAAAVYLLGTQEIAATAKTQLQSHLAEAQSMIEETRQGNVKALAEAQKDRENSLFALLEAADAALTLGQSMEKQSSFSYETLLPARTPGPLSQTLPPVKTLITYLKSLKPGIEVLIYDATQGTLSHSEHFPSGLSLRNVPLKAALATLTGRTLLASEEGTAVAGSVAGDALQIALYLPHESAPLSGDTLQHALTGLTFPAALSDSEGSILALSPASEELMGTAPASLSELTAPKTALFTLTGPIDTDGMHLTVLTLKERSYQYLYVALTAVVALPLICLVFSLSLLFNFSLPFKEDFARLLQLTDSARDGAKEYAPQSGDTETSAAKWRLAESKEIAASFENTLQSLKEAEQQRRAQAESAAASRARLKLSLDLQRPFITPPAKSLSNEFIEVRTCHLSSGGENGDFYTLLKNDEQSLTFILGHVHSDTPAPLMAFALTLLKQAVLKGLNPAAALRELQEELASLNTKETIALTLGILSERTGNFILASAGMPLPPLIAAQGQIRESPAPACAPLSVSQESEPVNGKGTLVPGDVLILASPGVAALTSGDPLYEGLKAPLNALYAKDGGEADAEVLLNQQLNVTTEGNNPQDMTLLALRQARIRF